MVRGLAGLIWEVRGPRHVCDVCGEMVPDPESAAAVFGKEHESTFLVHRSCVGGCLERLGPDGRAVVARGAAPEEDTW